ncbi:solute carrier family 2, facilitated glucose transporter member 11 isoform X1 [Anolis carolinensis]|uniref:solute carrier family 2, facilitated glucose transporter member 11 isoform X1 n=1 Tax=Anolis carolinensis TaxID=28377 RepID=UPI002F2B89A3
MEDQALLLPENKQTIRKGPTWTLLLCVSAAGIGGTFQYGYNVSVINAPTEHIQGFLNATWWERYGVPLQPDFLTFLWSVVASVFSLGGLCGAHLGGALAVRIGRKGALLANNGIALLASLSMGLSFPTGLYELLILGRFLIGINTGVGLCVQPMYIGESAPKHLRGALAMGSSIFLTGGILTGQVVGLRELLGGPAYAPFLISSCWIPAVIQLLTLPWFPESPRFLFLDRKQEEKCLKALRSFHGGRGLVGHLEMEDIRREGSATSSSAILRPWQLFSRGRGLRWQVLFIVLLTCGQQLSGINAIYFYVGSVFEQAGIPKEKIPYATLGTGACECLTALTCGFLVESMGRRALILGGYTLMTVWCGLMTVSLTFQVPYLSMTCLFAFILSFGLGPGGVTNILTMELFTQEARPAAYMIAGSVSWISFFTIGMLFPFIVGGLGPFCFLVFLGVCGLVSLFLFLFLPETKGRSFLEIQAFFRQRSYGKPEGRAEHKDSETSRLRKEFFP